MARVAIPRSPAGRPSAKTIRNACGARRIFALALAAVQGMGIAKAMEGLDDFALSPGPIFRLGVVVSIVGATAFLIWLARVMTERGIGSAHLPNDVAYGV
jgi:preprotein translocase subunit SecY